MNRNPENNRSHGEQLIESFLIESNQKGWIREHEFHPQRKWRFDFANPKLGLAIEVEGGSYTRGKHSHGKRFEDDLIKYEQALLLGWQVYRVTPRMIKKGFVLENILTLSNFRQQAANESKHQLIKKVTLKNTNDLLNIINST